MDPVEKVWNALKAQAREYAAAGREPTMPQARRAVSILFAQALVSPWPPEDVIEMYAGEMVSLTAEYRKKHVLKI